MCVSRACAKSTIRRQASTCWLFHNPVSCGLIRPSGVTAVDSVMISPNPPTARDPRCTRCQSVGTPSCSSTLYWHMGESQMRLHRVSPRRAIGSNNDVMTIKTSRVADG